MLATLFVALQLIPVLSAFAVDEACAIDDPSCSQPEGGLSLLQVKALKVGKGALADEESNAIDHAPKLPSCMKGCDGNICQLAKEPLASRKCGHECSDKETAMIKEKCNDDSGPPPPSCIEGCHGDICQLAQIPFANRSCGHECSDKETAMIKEKCNADSADNGPPPCAASCVGHPTCATLDTFVGAGGCAEFCDAALKDKLRQHLCNGEGDGEGNGEGNGQGNCGTYTCGDDETSFCGDCDNGEGNGEGNMNNGQGNCGTYTCGDDETSFCGDCDTTTMPPTMPTVAPPMPAGPAGPAACGTYTCGDDGLSFCGDCGVPTVAPPMPTTMPTMPPTMPTVAPPMPAGPGGPPPML